jgi:hypothetical protein
MDEHKQKYNPPTETRHRQREEKPQAPIPHARTTNDRDNLQNTGTKANVLSDYHGRKVGGFCAPIGLPGHEPDATWESRHIQTQTGATRQASGSDGCNGSVDRWDDQLRMPAPKFSWWLPLLIAVGAFIIAFALYGICVLADSIWRSL